MPDVTITVDGTKITAPAGTLLIEACRAHAIEVPAFCYYPGLSLQAACRMCIVDIEKMPKMQTACTVPITEGMVVTTTSEKVTQARKATIELLLGNHPLDCPVCDAGGECELQDMTFKYGAAESRYMEGKLHKDEQQWSPIVFFDRPRCILCYRCVRVCGEGMDVWALGVQNRNVQSVIAPNMEDHLDCEECGMCIDICPVGALTSGAYRYKTRPWEMNHVGTICTHCGDGCKTTLGVRRSDAGMQIVRGDNRDKSGINGDFLCIKGRYAFDFADHAERLRQPLIRKSGHLVPSSWEEAFQLVAQNFAQARDRDPRSIGVIGSTRTTNEESYLLQKFARLVLGSNNIDHHRTADFPAFTAALTANPGSRAASMRDVATAPAILIIGNDPTDQHPLLAWNIRTNVRLRRARLYVINSSEIKLKRQSVAFLNVAEGAEPRAIQFLAGKVSADSELLAPGAASNVDAAAQFRDQLLAEKDLVIVFGSELRGSAVADLVALGSRLPGARFICLADYANSRGAADMGLYPHLLPGYVPVGSHSKAAAFEAGSEWTSRAPAAPGLDLLQMMKAAAAGDLAALYVVGSNPVARYNLDPFTLSKTFLVVQDMFLTETAAIADVVLPAANAYEKAGTFTNTCGDLQMLKKAADFHGLKSDLEMIIRIADLMGFDIAQLVPFGDAVRADMGQSRGAQSGEADRHAVWLAANNLDPRLSPFDPAAILDEIQRLVPGYEFSRINLLAGNDEHLSAAADSDGQNAQLIRNSSDLIWPSNDNLFSSGTLGRYSAALNSVAENRRARSAPADQSYTMTGEK